MADCGQAIVPQERDTGRGSPRPGETSKPGLEIALSRPVELASIAGRQQKGGSPGGELLSQERSHLCRRQGKALALLYRSHMVADSNNME
jgi:hypothetical protein